MKLSESSFQELRKLIMDSLMPFCKSDDQSVVTDIHLQPIRETGQVTVSDDDRDLGSVILSDLQEIPEENFYSVMEKELRRVLQSVNQELPLDNLAIWKPYSFVLVDDDHETVSELMLFDEENTLLSQGLMQGLDEELDLFLKDLLSD